MSLDVRPAQLLAEHAESPPLLLYRLLRSSPKGLTEDEADRRLVIEGANAVDPDREPTLGHHFLGAARHPFIALLAALGVIFVLLGDLRGWITALIMIVASVVLRTVQQVRSSRAVSGLRDLVATTATVQRRADPEDRPADREVPVADVVVGDLVKLAPGDLVSADLRLLDAAGLRVDQSAVTGEGLPVSKRAPRPEEPTRSTELLAAPTLCFAGTSVITGHGSGIVLATGVDTVFGRSYEQARTRRPESTVDKAVRSVSWTLVRFMLVLAPIVLVVSGVVSGDWPQAVMFAAAVAVGLTPEMLPVVVSANLARAATKLVAHQVIVKRLGAIEDLGAMDVLCVDKTGTLTEDRIAFAYSVDFSGQPDERPANYATVAAHLQAEAGSRLDETILAEFTLDHDALTFTPLDDAPFDHARRRSALLLRDPDGENLLVCKGDADVVVDRCRQLQRGEQTVELTAGLRAQALDVAHSFAQHGVRVLAVAARRTRALVCSDDEEADLTLIGFLGFVDPVREGADDALRTLVAQGVAVKMLTGDNRFVATQVCKTIGLPHEHTLTGSQVDGLDDGALAAVVERTTMFAELTPAHKYRVVAALRARGRSVGFLGEGVNDATALRTADVGIAPDNATDVAKAAADLVLTRRDLAVLADGVRHGRQASGNTIKYVKITASSNFGNVVTVVLASVLLPFLPILPIQLLVQNLLYDAAQLALPWDRVDARFLARPRRFTGGDLVRFMTVFGPLSSVFDLVTFAVLWFSLGVRDSAVFQASWFIEGSVSQLLVLLVLRSAGRSFGGSAVSRVVALVAVAVAAIAVVLPFTAVGELLSLRQPAGGFLLWAMGIVAAYLAVVWTVKRLYVSRHDRWL